MKLAVYWPVATVLLFVQHQVLLVYGANGNCNFYFITQPPKKIPCNPYSSSSNLKLECSIVVPAEPLHTIEWYRTRDNNRTVEHLTSETNDIRIKNTRLQAVSSRNSNIIGLRSVLSIRDLDAMPNSRGTYWCQVRAEVPVVGLSFPPSTKTPVLTEVEYSNLTRCPQNTVFIDLANPLQCIDTRDQTSATASVNKDPSSSVPLPASLSVVASPASSSVVASHTQVVVQPTCSPPTNDSSLGLSSDGIIIVVAVGVPIFIALVILLLAVVLSCRNKTTAKKTCVRTVQLQSSSTSLESHSLGDGAGEAIISAGTGHQVQVRNPILPLQQSITKQLQVQTEPSAIPVRKDKKAATLIGKLKVVCQQSATSSGLESSDQQQYRGLNPDTLDPTHEYDAASTQERRHEIVHNGQVYHIVDPNVHVVSSGDYYTQPQTTTVANSGISQVTKTSLAPTRSEGEYVVPNNFGVQNKYLRYQGLRTDMQEYLTLYMTPDMQNPNLAVLEMNGHQYQLPNATSMDPPGVYAEPDS